MENMRKLREAYEFLKNNISETPEVALILGSGLGALADEVENRRVIKYNEIPNFPVSTVEGHAGQFVFGELEGRRVVMMQGRFHFYEGYHMMDVTFPIRILKMLGVEKLIVTNACGGANESFKPGDLMIIKDHINFSGTNPLIGRNLEEFGPRFPDMSQPYSRRFMELAMKSGEAEGIELVKGVYVMFTGPSYETPAEVRMARIMGGDAVGMSTVPEVIVANHSGMEVLGISCITNMAAGILDQPLDHKEVMETSLKVRDKFARLVRNIVRNM